MTGPDNAIASLQFRVGGTTSDVWIDDAHFVRTGVNVYRRDFEHGIVLVNPNADAMPVLLDQTYRRILGTVDPANDGSAFSQTSVPGTDALFLLRATSLIDAGTAGAATRLAFASVAPNPSPLGRTCTVRLAGARSGPLKVSVYDAAGRHVRDLFDGTAEAGTRTLLWDGADGNGRLVPRGLYFLRAEQAGVVATRKLVRA
jgi:hypothetical protein